MPHCIAVNCPRCNGLAEFEFAEISRIKLRKDIQFFQTSKTFEYRKFSDGCGHTWHGAIFFSGLHGAPENVFHDLPEGYHSQQWSHSKYWRGSPGGGAGSIRCGSCGYLAKHVLQWPSDAYFQVLYRGHLLWAFDRENAKALRSFLLSKSRDIYAYGYSRFMLHIPTVFKTAKARPHVTKALTKLLAPISTKQLRRSKSLSFQPLDR